MLFKKAWLILVFLFLMVSELVAQVETPEEPTYILSTPSYVDLNDTGFVQDKLYAADIERALRENYYNLIDGRFGGVQVPVTYYVELRKQQAIRDAALRAQAQNDSMLNAALEKENNIRAELLKAQSDLAKAKADLQNMNLTLFQWNDKVGKIEQKMKVCRNSRGRRC